MQHAAFSAGRLGQYWLVAAALSWSAPALADDTQAEVSKGQQTSGEPGASGHADLAKQLTNPIADLVSIPFQYNWRNGVGPADELQLVLNIQPVVPIQLTDDWNVVGRFIVPIISQPAMGLMSPPRTGFGDSTLSLFFSPSTDSKFQWGAGPAAILPLTTDPMLGSGRWSAGPTAVGLYMTGGWTFVLLGNHVWSYAETSDIDRPDVNQTFLQPVAAYTTSNAWTFTLSSETTINWEADDGDKATVPITGLVSKLTKLGPFPLSVQVGGGPYVEAPSGGPEWQLRMQLTVLLPARKDK